MSKPEQISTTTSPEVSDRKNRFIRSCAEHSKRSNAVLRTAKRIAAKKPCSKAPDDPPPYARTNGIMTSSFKPNRVHQNGWFSFFIGTFYVGSLPLANLLGNSHPHCLQCVRCPGC